ncbi:MAG: fused response regulator/phosphatase [Spirochaetales bacterium]|nr:fused response regulator/phosphatase [Spirochaetales bacterium]
MSDIKLLIVDDEPQVHTVTAMVLGDLVYRGRGVTLLSAYTYDEALSILASEQDVAVALIDVVMEEKDTGLKLVRAIRDDLKNLMVRILIRTGQPGSAPEHAVILEYDINDYREKTELTAQKLKTSVISCIRSYEDLCTISRYKERLEDLVWERTRDLEKAVRELKVSKSVIEADLKAGSTMQYKLLPPRSHRIGPYGFYRFLISSMYLSGDFVDYFSIGKGLTGFYILDVSGHGTSSAFMTVIVKNFIDKQLERYQDTGSSFITSPAKMAEYLNGELMREEYGKYFTMFYGVLNEKHHSLRCVNCGQFPFPLLSDGSKAAFITRGGPPVGLFSNASYKEENIPLPGAFQLLCISDGILEAMDGSLAEKKQRLVSCLLQKGVTIEKVEGFLGVQGNRQYTDDITFLLVERG